MSGPLGGDTVTILNAGLVVGTRYSTLRRDWATAIATVVDGCSLQPFAAAEDQAGREYTATRLRLFAPYSAPISANSRVQYGDTVYEVDGEPGVWRDDRGVPDHLEVVVKKLAG